MTRVGALDAALPSAATPAVDALDDGIDAGAAPLRRCSHSISRRLSQRLAVITMLVMALTSSAAWWSVRSSLVAKKTEELSHHSTVIADIIQLEARSGGEQAVRERVLADAYMRSDSAIDLWYADGRPFVLHNPATRPMSKHIVSIAFDIVSPNLPDGKLKAIYTVDVARDEALGTRWAWILGLTTLVSGALVLLGTRWRVRQMLRPLEDLAKQTRAIAPQGLHRRLELDDPAEELLPWVEQFNALMSRLERAYAQLEGFNADVAHELRTPLATLMMQTELALSRERSCDDLRETMSCSLEELQRMSALVNDMLFVSQADRGATARRSAPCSLAALTREVIEFHEAAIDDAALSVRIDGDASVAVDEPLIKRAVSNLLSNATRYARRGSTIVVQIAVDGPGARVAVSNEGPPIADADMPRLFDRFFRGDAARSRDRDAPHFGLGLAIVAAIARMHGGEPFAHSGAGRTRIGFSVARD